jgi:two-component system, OmpR family, alkaline phosphatase synthesis response regulator PhoP
MSAKILIVEDNADSCAYLSQLLKIKGYTVFTANDGLDALREIQKYNPDLIITDIMMPRADGIQLVKALRSTPKYRNIAVLVVSAYGSGNLKEALKAGADAAMRKPINFTLFFASLEKLLNRLPPNPA